MLQPQLALSITLVSDAPNCGITYDCHYDDRNSFIIQATVGQRSGGGGRFGADAYNKLQSCQLRNYPTGQIEKEYKQDIIKLTFKMPNIGVAWVLKLIKLLINEI